MRSSGRSKVVAAIVDKANKLQSVLVLEAWADADQKAATTHIIGNIGKIVTISNAKIVSKGRSLVYFDREFKLHFDVHTMVAVMPEDTDFPKQLP